MRRLYFAVPAILAASVASQLQAQRVESSQSTPSHRVTWTFNPANGTMQAVPLAATVVQGKLEAAPDSDLASSGANATATTYTGTVNVTFTIKLVSSVPKGAFLRCSGSVALEYESVSQIGSTSFSLVGGVIQSSQSVDATVSGTTATCKYSIPYSWTVPASSGTSVISIRGIVGSVGVSEDVLDSVTGVNAIRVVRSTAVELIGPASIPADGAVTTLTASTVL